MKLIVTVPALAVSVLLVNFNAPDGSAATASELLAALDELEDVAGALDAVEVLAGVLLDALAGVLLLLAARAAARAQTKRQGGHCECEPRGLRTCHISLLF